MDNYDLNFAYIKYSLTDILYVSYNNKLLNYNTNTNILDLISDTCIWQLFN